MNEPVLGSDGQDGAEPNETARPGRPRAEGGEPPRGARRWLPILARLVVFSLLLTWVFVYADRAAFAAAFASIPLLAFVPAALLGALVITIGGIRWRVLMGAFGAHDLPPALATIRLFFVGLFYNTFVPGSIGGDVVRGVVTRRYFESAAASYVVVIVERLIGFSAMGLVFLLGFLIGPDIIDVREYLPYVLALVGLGVIVLLVAVLSGRLAASWRRVPRITRPLDLVWVFSLSLVSHFAGITGMYALSHGMGLPIGYSGLVLVMPVAFTAAVIPLNVLGVGTREVSLMALLPLLGASREEALALSVGYAIVSLGLAVVGGLIQLVQGRVGTQ